MLTVDRSNPCYRKYSRNRQLREWGTTWLGMIDWNGVRGALGLRDGRYFMFRHHLDPLELPMVEILEALASAPSDER